MNFNCTAESRSEQIIHHSKSSCGTFYQILEKLPGTGYDQLGNLDDSITQIRLKLELKWALNLRTY